MGLLRMAARTAVVAGTATAVSGRVQRRQAARYDQQDQQQYDQQQYEQQQQYAQAPPPPPPAEDDATAQLQNLAKLHEQGVLTDEEFAASKAKILGI
jgi:transcription initiation factor TFIID subunit TAF12